MDNAILGSATDDAFRAHPVLQGPDEVIERHWSPNHVVEEHTHPFGADAVISAGEMWLVCPDSTLHLLPGDTFSLAAGTPHTERYGPQGCTYWVARRHPKAVVAS